MEKIDHNAHSVYLMYYHLIMVVKYRRKVINDPISERAKEIWEYIAPRYGIVLEEWNHDIDHVHVMFRAQPKTELSKFINAYKSASSRLLKKEYPEIRIFSVIPRLDFHVSSQNITPKTAAQQM